MSLFNTNIYIHQHDSIHFWRKIHKYSMVLAVSLQHETASEISLCGALLPKWKVFGDLLPTDRFVTDLHSFYKQGPCSCLPKKHFILKFDHLFHVTGIITVAALQTKTRSHFSGLSWHKESCAWRGLFSSSGFSFSIYLNSRKSSAWILGLLHVLNKTVKRDSFFFQFLFFLLLYIPWKGLLPPLGWFIQ